MIFGMRGFWERPGDGEAGGEPIEPWMEAILFLANLLYAKRISYPDPEQGRRFFQKHQFSRDIDQFADIFGSS